MSYRPYPTRRQKFTPKPSNLKPPEMTSQESEECARQVINYYASTSEDEVTQPIIVDYAAQSKADRKAVEDWWNTYAPDEER
ncbi:hypothetical protein [Crocosphaera sp.]|uniref:hypothetical protein n=1 Tax=Crocosphaera sp. TaxID=2729996 RepID=UPI002610B55B|nr:hypothetical protein [Crocosphaera sp.]MDJ0579099.1 hypothetical protein [Crocosphaera sp.]